MNVVFEATVEKNWCNYLLRCTFGSYDRTSNWGLKYSNFLLKFKNLHTPNDSKFESNCFVRNDDCNGSYTNAFVNSMIMDRVFESMLSEIYTFLF